jgi:twitching motility protein PilT
LLLVRTDKVGRVAAFEIMITTSSIQSLIRDNKTFRITSDMQTGAKHGMITMDAHLMALYQAGQIGYEDLITKSHDPDSIVSKLQDAAGKKK